MTKSPQKFGFRELRRKASIFNYNLSNIGILIPFVFEWKKNVVKIDQKKISDDF